MVGRAPLIAVFLSACGAPADESRDAEPVDGAAQPTDAADAQPRPDGPTPHAVVALSAGYDHTCALLDTGAVRCWGRGFYGLGYADTRTIGDDEPPKAAGDIDLGAVVRAIESGDSHVCAITTSMNVRCFGRNLEGELGLGHRDTIGDDETPATAGDLDGTRALALGAGGRHTCAILPDGALRCWGQNWYGELGIGSHETIGDDEPASAAPLVDVGGPVLQVAGGVMHTCALLAGGTVRCWGSGTHGQLGYPDRWPADFEEVPAAAGDVDVGGRVTRIACGDWHTCALLETGSVRCWGAGTWGALGYGIPDDVGDDEAPASAGNVDVGGPVVDLVAGNNYTCALLVGGAVRCWGLDGLGTSIIGDDEPPSTAGDVDVGGRVVLLAGGTTHTCALLTSGAVRCWGYGGDGILGYGNTENIGDDEPPSAAGDVQIF